MNKFRQLTDFNQSLEISPKFEGKGKEQKLTRLYNGDKYMIKIPSRNYIIDDILTPYKNSQFSEYIGCEIFRSVGIKTQETVLGFIDISGKRKIVVGCKDFEQDGSVLYEFRNYWNKENIESNVSSFSLSNNFYPRIEDVFEIVNKNKVFPKEKKIKIINDFWSMFIIDAFIGNPDRHTGNWGFLEKGSEIDFAPIYDCGSSLGASYTNTYIKNLMMSQNKFEEKSTDIYTSLRFDGSDKRVKYSDIFSNAPETLKRMIVSIVPKIDMKIVVKIIENTPEINTDRREYIKASVQCRMEKMLLPVLEKILTIDKGLFCDNEGRFTSEYKNAEFYVKNSKQAYKRNAKQRTDVKMKKDFTINR